MNICVFVTNHKKDLSPSDLITHQIIIHPPYIYFKSIYSHGLHAHFMGITGNMIDID